MELRADPAALAPERLLVFEVNGPVQNFAAAVRRVPGLEWIDEEELAGDEAAPEPTVYLLIPDARALTQLLSLWRQWQDGRALPSGYTPWRDVFALLRALRPWGPADRVADEDRDVLLEEIDGRADDETVRLEIELVFRPGLEHRQRTEADLSVALVAAGGRVLHRSRVDSIAYHAVLAELPVTAVRAIAARAQASIVGLVDRI